MMIFNRSFTTSILYVHVFNNQSVYDFFVPVNSVHQALVLLSKLAARVELWGAYIHRVLINACKKRSALGLKCKTHG